MSTRNPRPLLALASAIFGLCLLSWVAPGSAHATEVEAEMAFLEGLDRFEADDCEGAVDLFRTALRLDRRYCRVRYYYAQCLISLERPGEALMQAQESERCADTEVEEQEAAALLADIFAILRGEPPPSSLAAEANEGPDEPAEADAESEASGDAVTEIWSTATAWQDEPCDSCGVLKTRRVELSRGWSLD